MTTLDPVASVTITPTTGINWLDRGWCTDAHYMDGSISKEQLASQLRKLATKLDGRDPIEQRTDDLHMISRLLDQSDLSVEERNSRTLDLVRDLLALHLVDLCSDLIDSLDKGEKEEPP